MTDIPKTIQVHLNEIAERLNQGKATVMVGAGFSKNAVKIKNTDKKFLSWNELADLFYEKLNSCKEQEVGFSFFSNDMKNTAEILFEVFAI